MERRGDRGDEDRVILGMNRSGVKEDMILDDVPNHRHRAVAEPFTEKLVAVLRGLRVGPPLSDGVFMGPLGSTRAAEALAHGRHDAEDAGGNRSASRQGIGT